jgi:single-stranded-DNA-specific exonuclease
MDYQSLSSIVKEKHIRFVIFQPGSKTINGIGFGLVDKFDLVKSGNPFDILFHIEENLFNGRTSLQLKVLDIRASES